MILRWFPFGDDTVSLKQIKQIPGVSGVATCLPNVPVGEVWPLKMLLSIKKEINDAGLEMEVIESVNVHEDIKKGLPSRDKYINSYIKTIHNLSYVGIKCLCYNFMPVMDWIRNELAYKLEDGSSVMAYRHNAVLSMNPAGIARSIKKESLDFSMPGWEPERLKSMTEDIEFYQNMQHEQYWENMKYFLNAIIPHAEKSGIKMAIHPDDPPWSLFGLPKVISDTDGLRKLLALNDSVFNGLAFCTGSLGANIHNSLPAMIREFSSIGRIHFAHLRNIKHLSSKDFNETAHLSASGDLDMFEIILALYESGFDGYIRPDHGRMIWGEKARAGYGLYDRAIGSNYFIGLWEAIDKMTKIKTGESKQ